MNDMLSSVHDDHFLFSGKMPLFQIESLMNKLHLKKGTEVTSSLVCHAGKG
jgi:hypothetical protein